MPETERIELETSACTSKKKHGLCTNLIPFSSLGGSVGVADIIIGRKGWALGRGIHELNRAVLVWFCNGPFETAHFN